MKYFYNGVEITSATAEAITEQNNKILEEFAITGNITLLYQVKFIVRIGG